MATPSAIHTGSLVSTKNTAPIAVPVSYNACFFELICHAAIVLYPYSTVTDLARFRGWSTSVPRSTAT